MFAPAADEVERWFGARPPDAEQVERICYFIANARSDRTRSTIAHARQSIDEASRVIRAARAAVLELNRRLADLVSLSDDEIATLPVQSIVGFVPQIRMDLELLEYGLRAPTAQPEWQSIAQEALFCVIDPTLMSIGRDIAATADGSARVRALEKVLAACGAKQRRADGAELPVSRGAIREWLRVARISPTVFLTKNRFPK